ncbi:hypothetical protein ABZO31_03100 [Streptomyces sp. HUAS MG47]|uniref:hypothetical protein n=1 Tax=Streptomyces solicamelliae TaxID=3231716 RepID=UPI003877ADD7
MGTQAGLLQRGRGLGVVEAHRDPAAASLVLDIVTQDWCWDFADARELYGARLVRDLELPLDPLVALLRDADEHACARGSGMLCLLARGGSAEAREALRAYVRDGEHWEDTLVDMARDWPVAWWDDLADVARARLDGRQPYLWRSEPWKRWRDRIPLQRRERPAGRHRYDLGPRPDRLLAVLVDPGEGDSAKGQALHTLAGRPPEPALLSLVPELGSADGGRPLPMLGPAVSRLGAHAVPRAREWARDGRTWLEWIGLDVLARHGERSDVPRLTEALEDEWWQGNWCGPAVLAEGLARHGAAAADAVPTLRKFWRHTPHSHERPAYLEALAAIDPTGLEPVYVESLWDCEEKARLLAIASAPDLPVVRQRLAELADDPIEEPEVRAAAKTRVDSLS